MPTWSTRAPGECWLRHDDCALDEGLRHLCVVAYEDSIETLALNGGDEVLLLTDEDPEPVRGVVTQVTLIPTVFSRAPFRRRRRTGRPALHPRVIVRREDGVEGPYYPMATCRILLVEQG